MGNSYNKKVKVVKPTKPIDAIAKIVHYGNLGLELEDIVTLTGFSEEIVALNVKLYCDKDKNSEINTWRDTKVKVINNIQKMITDGITTEKVAESNLRDAARAFEIFHKAGRLEEGKGNIIVSHTVLLQAVANSMIEPTQLAEVIEKAEFQEIK